MTPPIIHFDYGTPVCPTTSSQRTNLATAFSPYAQKTKLLLTALGIPFQHCEQPLLLPRKDLEQLGITYRRIPVLAIGKDVYCDSSAIVDVILDRLAPEGQDRCPRSSADKAFEAYERETFQNCLALFDRNALGEVVVNDRKTIFPIVERPDFESLRPSRLAELQSRCAYVEDVLLAKGPYVGGDKLSVADVHVICIFRWALNDLGVKGEPGFGESDFPKLWTLIECLPQSKPEKELNGEEAVKMIQEAEYLVTSTGVDSNDPLSMSVGTPVTVESME